MNAVILTGRLTRDPELRTTPGGQSVCEFSIACNSREKDGSTGEWGERADFFEITCWGNTAESVAQYMSKGRMVGVCGRLRHERWENQQGEKRSKVKVVARDVQFLQDGKGDGDEYAPVYEERPVVAPMDAPPI